MASLGYEVYDHPVNQFVGGFVGIPPMNLFETTIADGQARLPGGVVPLPEGLRAVVSAGQRAMLGIRPEHIRAAGPGEVGHLTGVVEVVEPIPSDRIQIVHLRSGSLGITASIPQDTPVQTGDSLVVSFDPERVHLFDPASERNLLAPSPA